MPYLGAKKIIMHFQTESQAEAFWLWFKRGGGLETFMEADVSAELPESCVEALRPGAADPHYFFKFE